MKRLLLCFLLLFPLVSFAQDVTLRPGDVLHIALPGEEALNKDFVIDYQGRILLPEVGELQVGNKTFQEAKKEINTSLGKVYRDMSQLKIVLKERRLFVTVLGQVANPGRVDLPAKADVQTALTTAGGLLETADVNNIQLRRKGQANQKFNYKQYLTSGNGTLLPKLDALDTIFVPKRSTVRVIGGVSAPGQYEVSSDSTLLDVLAAAGGTSERADNTHVKVFSDQLHSKPVIFNLADFIQKGGSIHALPKIRPGYTVVIPQAAVTASGDKALWLNQHPSETIYLFGSISAPGRYKFNSDMSFLDILSAASGPTPDADLHHIRVIDRSGYRPKVRMINLSLYFQTGDQALLPKVVPGDAIYIPSRTRDWLDDGPKQTIRVLGAVGTPGRYQYSDNMTVLDLLAEAGGPSDGAYLRKILIINFSDSQQRARTFNLEQFSKTGDPRLLPVIRTGDTVFVPSISRTPWNRFFEKVRDVSSLLVILRIAGIGV